jgi:hypothetical protein
MAEKTVDNFAAALPPEQQEIIKTLRAIIKEVVPKADEAIKWAQPVFSSDGPMIFIRAAKAHVTLGFWRGAELTDPKGLLEGDGSRMKHIKIKSVKDVNKTQITAWIKQAMKLNKEKGDPTKGMKKK